MIQEITSIETFVVRHPVLRPGKPITACHFDGDDASTTKHFGYFDNQTLVGVVSVLEQKTTVFTSKKQLQIRGMAVLETHRNKNIGKKLLLHCEEYAKKRKFEILWFNARLVAVPFYEKSGYIKIGKPFEIKEIGTHYLLFKDVNRNRFSD